MKSDYLKSKINSSDSKGNVIKMRTLNEANVVRFWYDTDRDAMKVEMLAGNIIELRNGDNLLQDLKILDNDTKNFVPFYGKRINKTLVKRVERIIDPEFIILISMTNGKQYRIDSKQRISMSDGSLYETYRHITNLLK